VHNKHDGYYTIGWMVGCHNFWFFSILILYFFIKKI